MPLDPTHPARKFAGDFRLKSPPSPAQSAPVSQTDTLNLILLILKPRQQVRFRTSVTDTGLTLTPAFDDGSENWAQDFYFARHVAAPAPPAGTELVYETNAPDSDYSGGSTYYERRIVIKLGSSKIFTLDDQSLTRISIRSGTSRCSSSSPATRTRSSTSSACMTRRSTWMGTPGR